MDQKKLIELLRNPPARRQRQEAQAKAEHAKKAVSLKAAQSKTPPMAAVMLGVVTALVLVSLLFIFTARNRAENVSASLDKSVLQGLVVDRTFNPNVDVQYVQVGQGMDRNVSVKEIGTVLPVISRFNYRALTPKQYGIIGAAPYALTINVQSNLEDPDLLRYLFNQDTLTDAFVARASVAPLLSDPAALAKWAADSKQINAFLKDETVQAVLNNQKLLSALAGSRLFSTIIISKAVKYYRDRPAEAARLINANPALAALKKNQNVRKAVQENRYLKEIAPTLLK